jgi:transcriptional regulator with XRE-family HTH domain
MERTIHHGRNLKRFRELLGIKQETLAHELGEDWNQRKISLLEAKEVIDESVLSKISIALKIPSAAILNFDETAAINMIAETINTHENSSVFHHSTVNCTEKWLEAIEENRRLYERLIEEKDATIAILKQLLAHNKA